jgi:FkbM family methyltransferase
MARLLAWRFLSQRIAPPLWRSHHGTAILTPPYTWFAAVECFGYDSYGLRRLPENYPLHWFLDIGAHIGTFALAVLERWPDVRGIACEPSAESFGALTGNLQRNCASKSCECLQVAVVGEGAPHSVSFHYKPHKPSTSTILAEETPQGEKVVTVPTTSLAGLIRRVGQADLVKMDVEGAEYDIINGTPLELLSRIKLLVMEYHRVSGHSREELVARLAQAGLLLCRHEPPLMWFGAWPMRARDGHLEA